MNFPFDKDIVWKNELVLLRPMIEAGIDNLLPVATEDKDLLQFSSKLIYSRELLKAYIDKSIANRRKKNRYPFVVFDITKNAYAGSTARKAIEAIGGQFEGILRSHTLMSDGFRQNIVCYEILNPEWNKIKNQFLK